MVEIEARHLKVLQEIEQEVAAPLTLVLDEDHEAGDIEVVDKACIQEGALNALRCVYDPEIPVNIYDLGLIYAIEVDERRKLHVAMTLTAPGCPVAGALVGEVQARLLTVRGATGARTELVWDPPWTRDRMSEVALLELGMLW
jgi:FeS assembly SUF system protein